MDCRDLDLDLDPELLGWALRTSPEHYTYLSSLERLILYIT